MNKKFSVEERINFQNEMKSSKNPTNWLFENTKKYGFISTLDFVMAALSVSPEEMEEYYNK